MGFELSEERVGEVGGEDGREESGAGEKNRGKESVVGNRARES